MADRWFSGPVWKKKGSESKPKPKPKGKTLFVLHFRLFCKQDKHGNILQGEYSEAMLRQAAAKFGSIVILYHSLHREEIQPLLDLVLTLRKEFPNLEAEEIESTLDATEKMKRRIIGRGGRIKHVRNPREITTWNISRFIIDDEGVFEFTHTANAEEIGIEVEKPENFEDLKKKRQGRSFW